MAQWASRVLGVVSNMRGVCLEIFTVALRFALQIYNNTIYSPIFTFMLDIFNVST